jgi:hypothetical protein
LNSQKEKILLLLKEGRISEAEELARSEGISQSDWNLILNDYFWDWHTEH